MKKKVLMSFFITSILLLVSFNSVSGVASDNGSSENNFMKNINSIKLKKITLTEEQKIELEENLETMKDEDPGAFTIIKPEFSKALSTTENGFQFDLIKFGKGLVDVIQRVRDYTNDEEEDEDENKAKFFTKNFIISIFNKLSCFFPKLKILTVDITKISGFSNPYSNQVIFKSESLDITPQEIKFVERLDKALAKGPIKAIEDFTGEDIKEEKNIDETLEELGLNQPDWDDIDVDGGEEKGESDGHNWRGLDDKYDWDFFNASIVILGFLSVTGVVTILTSFNFSIIITDIQFLVLLALYLTEAFDFKDYYNNIALNNLDYNHYFEIDGY